ncbi:MAG: BamA/TamA family outer membrane protein, partial [bacterium]
RLPLEAFGSAEDVFDVGGHIAWREVWAGDGLIELAAGIRIRNYFGVGWVDRRTLARLRAATPHLGIGRLVVRADHLAQADQLTPALVTLGGDNGLRGYASQALFAFGADRLRANIEYRTRPWVLSFLHVGGVVFFDLGSIYTSRDDFALRSSAGVGLRMVVPQASSFAYRLDLGVPTDGEGFVVKFGFETSQAVPLTEREDLLYDFTVGGLYNQY